MLSALRETSSSLCPTPTVSMRIRSVPNASRTSATSPVDSAKPPNEPRVAIERMNTPGSSATSSIRMRSPRSAPPVNGDVGSTAITPTESPAERYAAAMRAVSVLLPAPGGPVMPMRRPRPMRACRVASSASNPGRWFSTMDTMRARAGFLPAAKSWRRRLCSALTYGLDGARVRRARRGCRPPTPRAGSRAWQCPASGRSRLARPQGARVGAACERVARCTWCRRPRR